MRMILLALALAAGAARAELAVSGNDGKQLVKGEAATVTPDSISVIEMRPVPHVVGSVAAPAAMIGPPDAIAVAADQSFAIVTAAQKAGADPMNPDPDDLVSVIGLADPAHPVVLQTAHAGPGASGVSINAAGTLVLVACKQDDAVHVFALAGKRLTHVARVALGDKSQPTDVIFAADGRHAYAVAWGVTRIMELAIDGARVTPTGNDVATGHEPYGAVITPDGRWLINTNVGGDLAGGRVGTLTMVDLAAHRLALSLPVGKVPEHVVMSPDGRFIALVLANGAATTRNDPRYDQVTGILKVFAIGPGTLTEVAHADSCHWAQGATWSDDGHTLLQQCATERIIQVFDFDGQTLARRGVLAFESRPGAIATHRSR